MSEIKTKRERAANFNNSEIRLLVDLVTKHKNVLENKKTDAVSNKDKDNAWDRIASSFNACSSSGSARSAKTLRLKYEGIKKVTKKKLTCHRQELYKTGGGPSKAPKIDEVDEKLLAITSNMTGLDARNDCDVITITAKPEQHIKIIEDKQYENVVGEKQYVEITEDIEFLDAMIENDECNVNQACANENVHEIHDATDDKEEDSQFKWSTWNPRALKTKVTPALKSSKSSVTAKLDQLSTKRLELVLLQQEIAKKEHFFVEEEHKLKMIHLKNEEARKLEMHKLLMDTMKNKN